MLLSTLSREIHLTLTLGETLALRIGLAINTVWAAHAFYIAGSPHIVLTDGVATGIA
jgi:hypothetical protein